MQNINFEDLPTGWYMNGNGKVTHIPSKFKFTTDYAPTGVHEAELLTGGDKFQIDYGHLKTEHHIKAVKHFLETFTWKIIEPMNGEQKDNPIKPDHYHKGGIDVIGFSEKQFSQDELKGFYRINCLKYITRYDRKGGLTDLKKADFYLGKLMEMEESK
jgi:hypothetical protein